MKYLLSVNIIVISFLLPQVIFAAQIVFSISPNVVSGDSAVILDAVLVLEDGESVNAIEGRIGILGEGAEFVTDVIVESGDSIFTFWPVPPVYEKSEKIIRFTGGDPSSITGTGKIFSLRLFSEEEKPISVSWLGGLIYQDDGLGTPLGVSSKSIVFSPHSGAPNKIQATSEDSKPPTINSVLISSDEDVFDGQNFLSIHATDDITGISHYEVIEDDLMTRVENGPYLIRNQEIEQQLHITVYDKAGNSISIKYPDKKNNLINWLSILIVLIIGVIAARYFIRIRKFR